MSNSYVKIEINNTVSINDYTRLLRLLNDSIVVESIYFEVD
jgi:hypothetical protein